MAIEIPNFQLGDTSSKRPTFCGWFTRHLGYSYLQTHTLEIMMQRCFVPCFGKQCFFVFEEICVDTMIPWCSSIHDEPNLGSVITSQYFSDLKYWPVWNPGLLVKARNLIELQFCWSAGFSSTRGGEPVWNCWISRERKRIRSHWKVSNGIAIIFPCQTIKYG